VRLDSNLEAADTPRWCRACGAELDHHRLGGLCPTCALGAVLEPDGEELEPRPPPGAIPSLSISGHEVLEEIARGGMGIVYRARQLDPSRIVALKMLLPHRSPSAEMQERFRLETRVIASLEHAAILPVYAGGEYHGMPYFTMKFAAGGTLAARRDGYRGQFRPIADLMIQIAGAVHFAHERGVLHRDLKPGNILFDELGRPYVSDFGLAKYEDVDDGLTGSAHLLGTPHYLAPEIATHGARAATTASDTYSLGAILYELLAGRPPFEAEDLPELLRKTAEDVPAAPSAVKPLPPAEESKAGAGSASRGSVHDEPSGVPPVNIPRDLDFICFKCLSKDPDRRYGTARELAEDLQRWLDGSLILARPVSRAERVWRWVGRNPLVALLTVLLALVLLGGGVALLRSNLKLVRSLGDTRDALQKTLLMQARLERNSGRVGQRVGALELLDRAAGLRPAGRAWQHSHHSVLRSEVAGALALSDLRPLARWSVPVNGSGSTVEFTSDLAGYAISAAEGGFDLVVATNQSVLRHFPGAADNPAMQFKFSADGRWLAAMFKDGHAEVHPLESARSPTVFSGHAESPTEVEFLPGGSVVLVATPDQGVVRLNLADDTRRKLIAPPATVTGLAADSRGKRFACFAGDEVHVRRVADGAIVWAQPFPNGLARLAWSPDGRQLAVAESIRPFETTVFDLDAGRIIAHFQDHELRVSRLAFHPDGRSLASVGLDNRLVWRQVGHHGWRLSGQAGWHALRFSADGQRLAYEPVRGEFGLLEVVPPAVFRQWRRTSPPLGEASRLAVSSDGRLAATASSRAVHLWNAVTREEIDHLPLAKQIETVTLYFHPEDQTLWYGGDGIGIMRVKLENSEMRPGEVHFGTPIRLSPGTGFQLHGFAPDRRSLLVQTGRDQGAPTVWLWPDGDPNRARPLTDGHPTTGYQLTANGRWGVTWHWQEPDVWIWNPDTAQRVRGLGIPVSAAARASPDGQRLLVTTSKQHQLWAGETWRPGPAWPHALQRDNWVAAFSADGRWLATAGFEGRVEIRTLPDCELLLELPPPHPLRLQDLAFSPERSRLYLLQANGRLFDWDLAALQRELARRGMGWEQ
jgi:eukaryotic-like serine/threonine-protein kinase